MRLCPASQITEHFHLEIKMQTDAEDICGRQKLIRQAASLSNTSLLRCWLRRHEFLDAKGSHFGERESGRDIEKLPWVRFDLSVRTGHLPLSPTAGDRHRIAHRLFGIIEPERSGGGLRAAL
jgi:hypothetical protein